MKTFFLISSMCIMLMNTRAQNVGIGTTTPVEKLTVQTESNKFGLLHSNGTVELGTFISNTYGAVIGTRTAHPLHFNASIIAAGEMPSMSILTNNNVGIGIPAPQSKLHVSNYNGPVQLTIGRSYTAGGYTALYMGTSALSNGYTYLQSVKSAGNAGGYGNLVLNQNGGNVGVGTINPAAKLDVSGNLAATTATIAGELSAGSNKALHVHTNGQVSVGANARPNYWFTINGAASCDDLTVAQGAFTVNADGANTAFRVHPNGQVSIGAKAATGYWFSVNGNMMCEEVKVQLSNSWPDYVFNSDYKLKNFDELRLFIDKNKHLPNIPAATELEKHGMEVGDMQNRMMEKIEELTLYILQLEKRIKSLESPVKQKL